MEKKQFNILIFVLSLLVVLQTCCLFVFGTKEVKAYEEGFSGDSPFFVSDNLILPSYDYYYHSTSINFVLPTSRQNGTSTVVFDGNSLLFQGGNFFFFNVFDSFGNSIFYNGSRTTLKTFLTYPIDSDFDYTPFSLVGLFSFTSGDTVLYCSIEGYDFLFDTNSGAGRNSYFLGDYIGYEFGIVGEDSKFYDFIYNGSIVPTYPQLSSPLNDDGYYYYYSYYFGTLYGLSEAPYYEIEVDIVVSVFVPVSVDLVGYYPSYASYFNLSSTNLLEHIVERSYNDFYYEGYEQGYLDGSNDSNINPMASLVLGVNSLLSTEIFPGFRLGYLFYIAIGVLLFTLLIKVFLK